MSRVFRRVIPDLTPEQRRHFWSKAQHRRHGECWLWTGRILPNGYGSVSVSGGQYVAHRVAYTLVNGPVPLELDLDHLCRVRACINPSHLEPVTRAENLQRSELTGPGKNIRKTHCIRGHSLADARRIITRTGVIKRACKACQRERDAAREPRPCPRCGRAVSTNNLRAHIQVCGVTAVDGRFKPPAGYVWSFARLTPAQVADIRRRYIPRPVGGVGRHDGLKTGSQRQLAEEFNVSPLTIRRIVKGQVWAEVALG